MKKSKVIIHAPKALGPYGRQEWNSIAKSLISVFRPIHKSLLEDYCRAYEDVKELEDICTVDGYVMISPDGDICEHPNYTILEKRRKELTKFRDQLRAIYDRNPNEKFLPPVEEVYQEPKPEELPKSLRELL